MRTTSNVGSGTAIASSTTGGAWIALPVTTVTSWPSSVSPRAWPSTCSVMLPRVG